MPRIRAEQLQGLTLTNSQISDGKRYDDNGNVIEPFDPSRLIDQAKIRSIEFQENGWISKGIVNRVDILPEWQAEYEGRLFYVDSTDELFLAVGTEPWFVLISGSSASGWDAELTARTGIDGLDWNGSIATRFQTTSYNFSPDGSDLFVYLNGSLQRLDHDYELIDQRTIRLTRNAGEFDTITMLVILSNSLLNYATKAWVYEQINDGGIQHSLDAAYQDGSSIGVDNRNVDWRLSTDKKFIVSEAITGVLLPAVHTGTEVFTANEGYDWAIHPQSFDVVVRIGGNVIGPNRIILNSATINPTQIVTELSDSLVTYGISELFGFEDNGRIGIQSYSTGGDISFDIYSGTNFLPIIGVDTGSFQGDDAYSSYQEFGLSINPLDNAGLQDNQKFWFSINGTEYSISTGINTTYDQLRSTIDTAISGFTATTETDDIRITNDQAGLAYSTNVSGVQDPGHVEITQVTFSPDVDRSLSGKYFELSAIDSALFGKEKPYYVWYHMDAEAEVSQVAFTAENSNITLADKYFEFSTPSDDYFVWYEVETPQTAGYQELGLTGINASTSTGLTQGQTYNFKAGADGASATSMSVTMPPDIQPTAEITEVTVTGDVSQSLSGRYWTLNSQTGTSYYVWYNMDTPAAPEITEITTTADVSQSLSGKSFSIFTPSQQYYAWLSMVTNPGQPALPEITEVTVTGDVSQSLSSKYFFLNSATGAQYYVWYEMMLDPGVTAQSEIFEVTTTGDVSQSLSSKYFEMSSPENDYYVWYRMQTAPAVSGEAEVTDVIIPEDSSQSLSGTYWTFNTPVDDYYVWYRMIEQPSVAASPEEVTATFVSNVESDYDGQTFRIYNFNDIYDFAFTTSIGAADTTGLINPTVVDISSAISADDIALAVKTAIDGASIPFTATNSGSDVIITCNNPGAQSNSPSGDTSITVAVSSEGTDFVAAVYSTNPAPADKTDIQINITENDVNTTVASLTKAQLDLIPEISTSINGATITITNDNNGAVDDAADFDAGVFVTVTNQGVNSSPATYSTNPSLVGKTAVVVDIDENDTADNVASLTAGIINALPQFSASSSSNIVTVETITAGATTDANSGDSGFTINVTQQGLDYVAPTYSTNPAPTSKTAIKVVISEDMAAADVAEATRSMIDANPNFSATRLNSVLTITDNITGPVADAVDVDTGFTINTTQQGQEYVGPTYTTDPGGIGNGVQVDINENATSTAVAQALESALNAVSGLTTSRIDDVVTVVNDIAGVTNDAIDIDTGFTINITQQGYEAYSSTDPVVVGKTGIQVNINENDSAELVAAKTQVQINSSLHFTASTSGSTVTIVDENGGAVADAADVDAGVTINVTNQGTDLIPADLSWGNILTYLQAATTIPATWSITGEDVRLTSNNIGSWTGVLFEAVASNSFITALGTSLDAPVDGTSSYSAQPSGTGIPVKVSLLKNSNAITVASLTDSALSALGTVSSSIGSNPGVDDHIVTITNVDTGAVNDITDSGTAFGFTVLNQGANESVDPLVSNRTGIRIDINKNDSANSVATASQSAIDIGGEFYATRLDNIISIQNDFPGSVAQTSDVNTGFGFTQTGLGTDVKYSLFGTNGLNATPSAAIPGIDAIPASTGVGTESLLGGYNFSTFPKDFAIVINGNPVAEVFLDQACFNSSEVVSHINARIADAGIINLEAYQISGQIGLRTTQTGASQTIELQNSLSDALATLGWSAGTYTGDFGEADSIFEVTALSGQNEILTNADLLPSAHGIHSIGAPDNKFKDLYVQSVYADAGTIYIGDAKISESGNEFAFTVDDGVNQYDFFGNNDSSIAPTGASRIGVEGVIGITPEKEGAQSGDSGTLQEIITGIAKFSGNGKVFPDMSVTTGTYGDPTNLKGFLNEKANGLYLKENEIVYISSLNRSVIILTQGDGIVEGTDWAFLEDSSNPVSGDSVKFDLTELGVDGEPTAGILPEDSFYVKTTGGIKLETGTSNMVHVTNDLQIDGDLIVQGDTVTLNTSVLDVEDNIITLNKNVTGVPTLNAGLEIERGDSTNSRLIWDENDEIFRAGLNGAEKSIAMRDESTNLIDNGIAVWNNSTAQFETTDINAIEFIQDVVGGMVSSNSEYGISVTYQDTDGTLDFNVNDPTITLAGAVTGSATMTNLGNVTINTTATSDPTLTLTGDVTGSATFTNLGDAALTATVSSEKIQDVVGAMVTSNQEYGISVGYDDTTGKLNFNVNDPTITLTGDVSGSATITNLGNASITATVANDSHTHDTRYYTESEADTRFVNTTGDTMTGDLTISNSGLAVTNSSSGVHVIQPQGGLFTTSSSTVTGYLKITLPVSWTSNMMKMTVDIFDYAGDTDGESIILEVGGYNYTTNSSWSNVFATVVSGRTDKFFNVRFGHDGTKCAIYIGESGSTWSYPQVVVRNVLVGFSSAAASTWDRGWSVGFTTTLGTITKQKPAENVASFAVNAGTVDGVSSESFLRSDVADVKTAGNLTFNDNIILGIGSGNDVEHSWNGTNYYTDINGGGNWYIRDGNSSNSARFTFDVDAGSFLGNNTPESKIDGFEKVYNAVWNDIADFIEVEDECIVESGKCYYVTPEGKHMQTTEFAQRGTLGIASDTYGYGLGKDDNKHQLPVAVGGFVLAYIDGNDFVPGDALASGPDGKLVLMSDEEAAKMPHRIVATYYKPEPNEEYHGLEVNGRHWVKVK